MVEEESLREAARLLPGAAGDRQAGAGERRDLAGRRRRPDRAPVPAGPDDAGEVDRVAGRVDRRPAAVGDQRLPGRPASLLHPGAPDRLAEAGPRRRVGIEDDEQVAARLGGALVAAGGKAEVAGAAHDPRRRRQSGHGIGGAV